MNRRERRAAAARRQHNIKRFQIRAKDAFKAIDISVEGKDTPGGPVVMIIGNAKGRRLVEEFRPEVEWSRDPMFAQVHPDEQWAFTHVRVTQLPQHLAATGIRPEDATSDSLAFAVALALQAHAEPRRVVHWVGHDADMEARFYDTKGEHAVREIMVEYIAPVRTAEGTA